MTNFEKIIIFLVSLLIIAVLAFGIILFRQQKDISGLKSQTGAEVFTQASSQTSNQTSSQAVGQTSVQNSKESNNLPLTDVIKQFSGTVKSISGNQLTVSVKLPDFSKPRNPDKLKNAGEPVNLSEADFEVLDKKITVNTNDKTIFTGKQLADLKIGDMVSVISDKSPYSSETVTAEKVIVPKA